MRSELFNLSLFVSAIAKVLLMTGLGMGGVVALLVECCGWRVVALGFEKVFGLGAVSLRFEFSSSEQVRSGNKPWARKARRYA